MASRWGKHGNGDRLYFPGLWNHCGYGLQPWNWKMLVPWKNSYDKLKQHLKKKQRHYFANKGLIQSYGFSSSHKWMWESEEVKVKSYSRVWLFAIPRTIGHQASLSMGLFRQEYWNGLPFPSPGCILTQRLNPGIPHCRQTFYPLSHQGSPVL